MSPGRRLTVMLIAAGGLLALLVVALAGLPEFGHYQGPYGTTINHVVSTERQATNAVTAVVFDYRGFDTLGEELILFVAVIGVMTLLRERREDEEPPQAAGRPAMVHTSDALRHVGVVAVGVTVLLALQVIVHGVLTPGGGFQGGVVLGAALMLAYFAGDVVVVGRLKPAAWMEVADAIGAGGLALIAIGGLVAGAELFHNFIDTGRIGHLNSGGAIALDSAVVGLEVFAASLLMVSELLEASLLRHRGPEEEG